MVSQHKTDLIIRYAETDQMGLVHHASYALYFEAARVEHMKAVGAPYHVMEAAGFYLPVIQMTLAYHKPARFGDTVTVVSRIPPLSGIRLTVEYEVYRGKDLLVSGSTLHAFTGTDGKPRRPSLEYSSLFGS